MAKSDRGMVRYLLAVFLKDVIVMYTRDMILKVYMSVEDHGRRLIVKIEARYIIIYFILFEMKFDMIFNFVFRGETVVLDLFRFSWILKYCVRA